MNSVPSRETITSAANAWLKDLRRLAQDNTAFRRQGRLWLEGDHLCRAALSRGFTPLEVVVASSFVAQLPRDRTLGARRIVELPDELFDSVSGLESPARMGFVMSLPEVAALDPHAATVVLDRVQDAGNVGSILRSAGAFGFKQVLALKGSAALWSPKVLRAGMGAHFGLSLHDAVDPAQLDQLQVPLVVTSSHRGDWLHEAQLPPACAWVMGHEGQGVSADIEARAAMSVRIAQPGGEESLNVAAAAAVCLHASAVARTRASP